MVRQPRLCVLSRLRAPHNFEGAGEGVFLHFFCIPLVSLSVQHMVVDHSMEEEEI